MPTSACLGKPFSHVISRLTVVSREAKKYKARAHNNKHATTTVSHLHEGLITQSFKISMAKSQAY